MKDFESSIGKSLRAYKKSAILFAAIRLELFDSLASHTELDELAEDVSVPPERLLVILDALESIGLVVRDGKNWSSTPEAHSYLRVGDPGNYLAFVRYHSAVAEHWFRFANLFENGSTKAIRKELREKKDASFERDYSDVLRRMSEAIIEHDFPFAEVLPDTGIFIDMGCGPAMMSMNFLKRNPKWRAVLIDHVRVRESVTRTRLSVGGVPESQVTLQIHSLLEDRHNLHDTADVVYMGHVIHELDDEEAALALKCAYRYLKRGGTLVILDFDCPRNISDNPSVSLFAASVLLFTGRAVRARSSEAVAKLVEDADFDRPPAIRRVASGVSYESFLLTTLRT